MKRKFLFFTIALILILGLLYGVFLVFFPPADDVPNPTTPPVFLFHNVQDESIWMSNTADSSGALLVGRYDKVYYLKERHAVITDGESQFYLHIDNSGKVDRQVKLDGGRRIFLASEISVMETADKSIYVMYLVSSGVVYLKVNPDNTSVGELLTRPNEEILTYEGQEMFQFQDDVYVPSGYPDGEMYIFRTITKKLEKSTPDFSLCGDGTWRMIANSRSTILLKSTSGEYCVWDWPTQSKLGNPKLTDNSWFRLIPELKLIVAIPFATSINDLPPTAKGRIELYDYSGKQTQKIEIKDNQAATSLWPLNYYSVLGTQITLRLQTIWPWKELKIDSDSGKLEVVKLGDLIED